MKYLVIGCALLLGVILASPAVVYAEEDVLQSEDTWQDEQADPALEEEGDDPGLNLHEPMLFDLGLQLGAKKGEAELNTLFNRPLNGEHMEWGPEFEYAFRDGYTVEIEVPRQDGNFKEYKAGLQGTFSMNPKSRYAHGWQYSGLLNRDTNIYSSELIYISGYRWNRRWSTLNTIGIRKSHFSADDQINGLLNLGLFYDASRKLAAGLEINLRIGTNDAYIVMPQIHYQFSEHYKLQLGAGIRKEDLNSPLTPMVTWRLIYAF